MKSLPVKRNLPIYAVLISTFLLGACSSGVPAAAPTSPAAEIETPIVVAPAPTQAEDQAAPTSESDGAGTPSEAGAVPTSGGATNGANDLDNALAAFPEPALADGEVLVLVGRVLNTNGEPLAGAAVEIWQTDAGGIYDHPGAPGTANRDPQFQFYGTSNTDEQGRYQFRTVVPQEYGSRPPHIHLKVKRNGDTLLTSQFYFEQSRGTLSSEPLFAQAGALGDLIILAPQAVEDAEGNQVLVAQKDLIIDLGGGGALTATPAQAEGPYYPVVDVSTYDNDLTRLN